MPEQLLGRIIRACSNDGDLVLDPFAGSGTTPAVAKKLGRRFVGLEISEEYARNIEDRLSRVAPGDPLHGPENATLSAPATKSGRRVIRSEEQAKFEPRNPSVRRLDTTLGQIAVALGELNTALTEAYLASADGYAIDRVIADPPLNHAFLRACRDLGVPMAPTECNRRLLGLRKAGKLSGLPRPRRTMISWAQLEPFAYASEIAWQILADRGHSLDDVLCDPDLAREFDGIAARFDQGHSPFEYRWAALTLRKQAADRRTCAKGRKPPEPLRRRLSSEEMPTLEAPLPAVGGLYTIRHKGAFLYLGETADLQTRIQSHCRSLDAFAQAVPENSLRTKDLVVAAAPFPATQEVRWGVHSRLLTQFNPKLNDKQQAFIPESRSRRAGLSRDL
jgi:site-specific DNA-methyltransferase (adenine-specific)